MIIAGVQHDIKLSDVAGNLDRMETWYRMARANGADLTVFPECTVAGYCFDNLGEARPYGQNVPGPATKRMQKICSDVGGFAVFGLLEIAPHDGLFNSAVIVGPNGVLGSYRKIHLPYLGVDRFATFGDRPFEVHDVAGLKIGMNICYDSGFPESSRVMSLQGADLIVLPTNWPSAAVHLAEHTISTRALENGIYYIAVNRVGEENGTSFIGTSSICAPDGEVMAMASRDEETIIYAQIDPRRARQKLRVRQADIHMIDRIADRRPEMYSILVEPHNLKRPGR